MRIRAALAAAAVSVSAAPIAHAQSISADDPAAYGTPVSDPFEGWNRAVFSFNEAIDKAALEPVAKAYRYVTPGFVRTGVRNALDNLEQPVTFANDVLQGAPTRAGVSAARFGINSTIGVLGLFDVAEHVGLPDHDEDFGQTLGRWGVGGGPYLMLPLLGPSNMRDLAGRVGDVALDPITYADFRDDDIFRATRTGLTVLSARTDALDAVQNIRDTSTDPYVTIRSLYTLSRDSAILNGEQNVEDLPAFDAPLDDLETAPTSEGQQSAEALPELSAPMPEPEGPAEVPGE